MKIKKEVIVCDFCTCDRGSLTRCKVCGKQYCFMCQASYENTFSLDVCKRCERLPGVRKLIEKYLDIWRRCLYKGNKELKAIKFRDEKKKLKEQEKE